MLILVLGALVVFSVQNISAEEEPIPLSCTVTSGACSGVVIFNMQALDNSHAELNSQSNYSYKVCCAGTDVGNSCVDNHAVVLNLSGATNAHVEENGQSNYANTSCLSCADAEGTVTCDYANDCATLGEDFVCLASISGATNAHVGDCNAYASKVCCQMGLSFSNTPLPIWKELAP